MEFRLFSERKPVITSSLVVHDNLVKRDKLYSCSALPTPSSASRHVAGARVQGLWLPAEAVADLLDAEGLPLLYRACSWVMAQRWGLGRARRRRINGSLGLTVDLAVLSLRRLPSGSSSGSNGISRSADVGLVVVAERK